ncbi:MAG TPA: hypothetical protein VGH28_16845 [Polyangiaceae bacterium]|jgi:hypothetical protein
MPEPPRASLRQILLGALLLWQVFFLFTANLATLVDGPLRGALDAIDHVWAEVACQHQVWGQYSPNITRHAIFAAVEFRWADGSSIEVRSESEENDPFDYVQDATPYRVGLYEGDLIRPFWDFTAATMNEKPAAFVAEASERIRSREKPIVAYLDWQRRRFIARHPNVAPPVACVLRVHVWVVPEHDQKPWTWPPPDDVPFARWRPDVAPPPGDLAVEVWDPAKHDFEYVAEKP